ncbi:MAG TPA: hypothetical protein PLK55_00730 [archaeon]|jgi:hypothetical protein|nr:hypothetical protein [archaeon]
MPATRKTETNLPEAYKPKRGPKAIIDYFFFKIGIKESIFIVLFAIIINILIYLLFKGQDLGIYILNQLLTGVILTWLVLGLAIYLIMYFIRGQKNLPKKPYEKVLSAIAAFRATSIIYTILCALLVFTLFPSIISSLQMLAVNPSLINSATLFPELTLANMIGAILVFLLTIFMIVYWLIMLYEFTEIGFEVKKPVYKIALTLVLMALIFLISLI